MRIAVIGGGVIGLTTGIILLRKGHSVRVYASAMHPNITSSQACAIWLPVWTTDSPTLPKDYNKLMERWCIASWEVFRGLVGDEYGIQWKTNHEMWPTEVRVPEYLPEIFPDFRVDTSGIMPQGFDQCWSCRTLVIETPVYMTRLLQDYITLGGEVVHREFKSMDSLCELEETVVFNCTGMGARELFQDDTMYEVKGQLLLHEPVEIDFAFGAGDYCLIPRSDALVLGSIFQSQFDTPDPTVDNADRLWSVISDWCQIDGSVMRLPEGTLAQDRIIGSVAGTRPYRAGGVRLEIQELSGKLLIHDYGHGGGGVTLSWGCAQHTVELLDNVR